MTFAQHVLVGEAKLLQQLYFLHLTVNYLYQISCVCLKTTEGLGEPTATRDARVERWHSGRRLKFSTTLAVPALTTCNMR